MSDALPARLLATLPSTLKLEAASVGADGVGGLLEVVRREAEDVQPGATAVFAKR